MKCSFLFLFARFLAYIKRVPLVNNFFISMLLTFYYDRKLMYKNERIPKVYYWVLYYVQDFLEGHFSDILIADTSAHIKYYHETFNISLKKFRRVFIGARDDIFYPMENKKENDNKILIGFWGNYIPLQGVKYIIKAIKLLENEKDLHFILIGKGKTYIKNRKLADRLNLKNVEFIERVPIEQVPKLISRCDIGLGIFGDSYKTQVVIPNKIYDGIAMKIPMISCEIPAIGELFIDNENIILCKPANPESLAKAILKLKNDKDLRVKIEENAFELFRKYCNINSIGRQLAKIFNNLV